MSDAFAYVVSQPFDGHEIGRILTRSDLAQEGEGEVDFAHRVGSHLIRVAVTDEPTGPALIQEG